MTESLWTASFLILENWVQRFNTRHSIVLRKGHFTTISGEMGKRFPLHTAIDKLQKTPRPPSPCRPPCVPAPQPHSPPLCLHPPLRLSFPVQPEEPFSSLAFPFISSHPSLRLWSLGLLHQIRQKDLLTVSSRTQKNWKLGEEGSGICSASKLPGVLKFEARCGGCLWDPQLDLGIWSQVDGIKLY